MSAIHGCRRTEQVDLCGHCTLRQRTVPCFVMNQHQQSIPRQSGLCKSFLRSTYLKGVSDKDGGGGGAQKGKNHIQVQDDEQAL